MEWEDIFKIPEESITERQLEYINILSGYISTKERDSAIIVSFLEKTGKKKLQELSKTEASNLIQELLKIPVEYEFPCGLTKVVHKQEYNSFSFLGGLEGCLHACPKEIDVNECEYLRDHLECLQDDEYKEYEDESLQRHIVIPLSLIEGENLRKCAVCNKTLIENYYLENINYLKNNPDVLKKFLDLIENFNENEFVCILHRHHIDYENEITVDVCPSCHVKIHKSQDHPLKPKK